MTAAAAYARRGRLGRFTAIALIVGAVVSTPALAAAPGALDPGFGGDGLIELPAGTQLNGAAVQRDGKLVVTGLTGGIDAPRLLVARVTAGGGLDPSFGAGGLVTGPLPPDATGAIGEAVAIAPDGRIIVAGAVRRNGADGMLIARLNTDGGFDASFAGGGVNAVLRGGGWRAVAKTVAIRPDGGIVAGGAAADPGENDPPTGTVIRLGPNGSLLGVNRLDIGEATIEGLALQPDGKIAIAGSRKPSQTVESFIGRLTADATKDAGFRDGGVFLRQLARNGGSRSVFNAIAVQADGRLVATGLALDGAGDPTPGAFRITARVDASGNPDGSFGPDGVRYTAAASSSNPNTLALTGGTGIIADSGHVYTGGSRDESGSSALAVQAQNADGNADGGFGTGGETITPVRSFEAPGYGQALALSPDGLYVVGSSGSLSSDGTTGVIARYGAYPFAFPPLPGPPPGGSPPGGTPHGGTPAGGAPPAGTPPEGGTVLPAAAKLSKLTLSPRRIKGAKGKATLRYTLSKAAKVRVTVEQRRSGRRKGSKCSKPSSSNRRGKRCTFYLRLTGSRTLSGRAGANRLTVTRKVTSRTLKPGTYRLVLQVIKGAAPVKARSVVTLTIAK